MTVRYYVFRLVIAWSVFAHCGRFVTGATAPSIAFGYGLANPTVGLFADSAQGVVLSQYLNSTIYTSLSGAQSVILDDGAGNIRVPGNNNLIAGVDNNLIVATQYGMVPDNKTDCTMGLYRFFQAVISGNGTQGRIPAGNYMFYSPLTFDVSYQPGGVVSGAGNGITSFFFQLPPNTPNAITFTSSYGGTARYLTFTDIALTANTTSSVLAIGRNNSVGSYPDSFANMNFQRVSVTQLSTVSGTSAVEVNGFKSGVISMGVNCTATNTGCSGITLNSIRNSEITLAVVNAQTGINIPNTAGGSVAANAFVACRTSNVAIGVQIQSPACNSNTFFSGNLTALNTSVNAIAGSNNMFSNTAVGSTIGTPVMNTIGCTVPFTTQMSSSGTASPIPGVASNIIVATSYGMSATPGYDNWSAIQQFFYAIVTGGNGVALSGYIPAGVYWISRPLTFDFSTIQLGSVVTGAGTGSTILNMTMTTAPINALTFTTQTSQTSSSLVLREIGIIANTVGSAIAVGRNATYGYPDKFTSFTFNLAVTQTANSATSACIELNNIESSVATINCLGATPAAGTGIIVNMMDNTMVLGQVQSVYTGLSLPQTTTPTNPVTANVFQDMYVHNTSVALAIANPKANSNTWLGGNFSGTVTNLNSVAGQQNTFTNTVWGPTATYPVQGVVGCMVSASTMMNSTGGASAILPGIVIASNYGVLPSNPDNTVAFQYFLQSVLGTKGSSGFIPSGTYVFKSLVYIDVTGTSGQLIYGSGSGNTILSLQLPANTPNGIVLLSNSATPSNYFTWRDMAVVGSTTSALVAIGRNATSNFLDVFNALEVNNIAVTQGGTTASAVGLEVNGVNDGDLDVFINGGGLTVGAAMVLNYATNTQVEGTFLNALISISIPSVTTSNGAVMVSGNNFNNIDCEASGTALSIASSLATQNTFLGGTYSGNSNSIVATAGAQNLFVNAYLGTAVAAANQVGIEVVAGQGGTYVPGATVITTLPASGVSSKYPAPVRSMLCIGTSTRATTVAINAYAAMSTTSGGCYPLLPGDAVKLTYQSGYAPASMLWRAF